MPCLKNAARLITPARSLPVPLTALILCATLAGCGNPDSQPASTAQTDKLCAAIRDAGYTRKCSANQRERTVAIVGNTDDDQAARDLCAAIAGSTKLLNAGLTGQWQLQIYSPYRDDKPLTACFLY